MHWRVAPVALSLGFMAATAAAQVQGPSSSETPYILPADSDSGWKTVSVLTVGDRLPGGYTMVGIPDGLGTLPGYYNGRRHVSDGRFITVLMNHELSSSLGIPRAHGATGAFVSEWTLHLNSLTMVQGGDLIKDVYLWDTATGTYVFDGTAAFSRLCSADLPAARAFYNPRSGRGFRGRLFMNGEESGAEGRAFAHVVTGEEKGNSYELPHLGRFSWENSVAHPDAGDRTIVVGTDDSTPGQIYVYLGNKRRSGNPVERAGLVGGALFAVKVTNGGANYGSGEVNRENQGAINGTFTLVNVSPSASELGAAGSGAALQARSVAAGATEFARPEDSAWDTVNPKVLYVATTGGNVDARGQSSKLYRLTFDSLDHPTGGKVELIVDRADLVSPDLPVEPLFAQFDNLTVSGDGMVMVQEDPGNTPYLARIWQVNPKTRTATAVLTADPARFLPPTPAPFNQDEESSGIIEVTDVVRSARWFERGRRYFLADLQAHYGISGELAEGGQLLLVASPRARGGHGDKDDDQDDDKHRDHDQDDDKGRK